MKNINTLTVYKASAGSGKTFRLTVEYIKLLILNPSAYENILAVTFTNKATEEMKMRILSQLYGISNGLESSQGYLQCIQKELKEEGHSINEETIRLQTNEALHKLLHSYSKFHIETIDHFFQTILRNLARELDLSPNLKIELLEKEIESQAVDNLLEGLKPNDKVLLWIMSYIHNNMDEQKNWNVIQNIKSFGEQLFNDNYKKYSHELDEKITNADSKWFDELTNELRKTIHDCQKEVNERGEKLIKLIEDGGYSVADIKNNLSKYIAKLPTSSFVECDTKKVKTPYKAIGDDSEADAEWTTGRASQSLKDYCKDIVKPEFVRFVNDYEKLKLSYFSALTTLSHLSELRLLQAIRQQMQSDNAENGRFLLADTQTLLNKMIDSSDSPFIYEKIGTYLKDIMIDEFQDTSRVQWDNFKVLLQDCMSKASQNLIVGDVKQSIYRWRSGDWRMLNNIDKELNQSIKTQTLQYNFRSTRKVIEFNNMFFRIASRITYNDEASTEKNISKDDLLMLKKAYTYKDLKQEIPSSRKDEGYVESVIIAKDKEYKQNTCDYIVDIISRLEEAGVHYNDIAILARERNDIKPIASAISARRPDISFTSDDAISLGNSVAVNIIADAIALTCNPNDKILRAQLAKSYQTHVLHNNIELSHITINNDINSMLPEEFVNQENKYAQMPLYQLAQNIAQAFKVDKVENENAFIYTFMDYVNEFILRFGADTPLFVKYWTETLCNKNVQVEGDNGITITTIHKSKGLEYDHVICPFLDWDMMKSNILWCNSDVEPYNQIPAIPLNFGKDLSQSYYQSYYWEEHLQKVVDDLNILYVAFTRASKNLFIITKEGNGDSTKNREVLINRAIMQMYEKKDVSYADSTEQTDVEGQFIPLDIQLSNNPDFNAKVYSFGKLWKPDTQKDEEVTEQKEHNVFTIPSTQITVAYNATPNYRHEFKQSNKSKEFTITDEEETKRLQYIKLGNLLHYVFQNIHTIDDIDSAVNSLQMNGMLGEHIISKEKLRQQIEKCLSNTQAAKWFEKGWQVYNECNIIEKDNTSDDTTTYHRPDRIITNGSESIVIDFKLATAKPEYDLQVKRYMNLLYRMGHKKVKGYLWYIMPNKIVEVK